MSFIPRDFAKETCNGSKPAKIFLYAGSYGATYRTMYATDAADFRRASGFSRQIPTWRVCRGETPIPDGYEPTGELADNPLVLRTNNTKRMVRAM